MGKKRKKRRSIKNKLLAILAFVSLSAAGWLVVVNVFTVEEVKVEGSVYNPEEDIRDWLLNDEYCGNSLYVYLKYKFVEPEEMPFVDTAEVFLKPPHRLTIKVKEKDLMGRIYISATGQNAYFDGNGIVVEMSSDEKQGVPNIKGMDVDKIVLGKKLPIKGDSVLKHLLTLTDLLAKYEQVPGSVKYNKEGGFTLKYGKVSVQIGTALHLDEKVVRLSRILPLLDGKKGTLHLEGWTEHTTDITFEESG
ncbi:cell division protein FtsQ [Lachnospiraceae bacterium 29-84]